MAAKELRSSGLRKDDKVSELETSGEVDVTPSFDALGLKEDLLRGIYAYGKQWLPSRHGVALCGGVAGRCSPFPPLAVLAGAGRL